MWKITVSRRVIKELSDLPANLHFLWLQAVCMYSVLFQSKFSKARQLPQHICFRVVS